MSTKICELCDHFIDDHDDYGCLNCFREDKFCDIKKYVVKVSKFFNVTVSKRRQDMPLPERGQRRLCGCKDESCVCRGRCKNRPKLKTLCQSCAEHKNQSTRNLLDKKPFK
jgi:hypothetical protein